jgi:hypothetical protein
MKSLIHNSRTKTRGGLMTGACLGVAMTAGGIPAILNMMHNIGIALEDHEVGAHFIGGEPEVHQMKGDTPETVLEVQTKVFIQETIRGPGFAVPGTEQARALKGKDVMKLVIMRFL